MISSEFTRRRFLETSATVLATSTVSNSLLANEQSGKKKPALTNFQLACMTLPYSQFPLQRALTGIKRAGFQYVAWGTSHRETEGGQRIPVMPTDAPTAKAKELGKRCRGMGLEPVMMFSTIYPENDKGLSVLTQRLKQAAAAGVDHVLTFGHTKGGNRKLWMERFKKLGPIARDLGVLLVVKQHGGSTGTGEACAEIVREVDDAGVWVNYDAGNVMDYLNVDPIPDITKCANEVRSFCLKDHRNWPRDQDCGPGFGEIDHYRLMTPVAFTGHTMPLCFENIFAPVIPRPTKPEGIDDLARRCREYMQTVLAGVQTAGPTK